MYQLDRESTTHLNSYPPRLRGKFTETAFSRRLWLRITRTPVLREIPTRGTAGTDRLRINCVLFATRPPRTTAVI
jgi:hypothetical protein